MLGQYNNMNEFEIYSWNMFSFGNNILTHDKLLQLLYHFLMIVYQILILCLCFMLYWHQPVRRASRQDSQSF